MEYLVLIITLVVALTVFRFYIQRGLQGGMMRTGETYGYGRQFDHRDTLVCKYDDKISTWYSEACYAHGIVQSQCEIQVSGDVANLDQARIDCENAVKRACAIGCG